MAGPAVSGLAGDLRDASSVDADCGQDPAVADALAQSFVAGPALRDRARPDTVTDSFDADFGVDEWHGHNVFFRDGERVFRTYFINNRGDEAMGSTWSYLDATPLGRQETWEDSPEGYPQSPPYKWWNWHDNYAAEASPDPKWVEVSDAGEAAFRNLDAGAKA
jgi:predicted dithiol-disulfide oxidoreductase (DUF899 family)